MNEYRTVIENTGTASGKLNVLVEWLLLLMLAFMPLALGVRSAWSEEVVIAVSGIIFILFLLSLIINRSSRIYWSWAYLPVCFFILICLFQLIPLSEKIAGFISPNTLQLKKELLGDITDNNTILKNLYITFYPNATKHDLRLILSIAVVFFVVFNVYRSPGQIRRLLFAIAMIGGVVAVIAMAQNLFGNGKIYWFITSPASSTRSGPFVNRNHYGQFMNLSIGAAIGWLCMRLHEVFAARKISPSVVYEYLGHRSAKEIWLILGMMVIGAASIFISLTRGGMVSLIAASALITLLLASRPSLKGRGWIMAVMALGAFACILYVGFDAVYDRFATLREMHAYEGRLQILKDLTASYRQFPVLGTGLGTHSVVYPMFKQINNVLLYTHAENEYAQMLEETGLVGLTALIILAIIIAISFIKIIRNSKMPLCSCAYGLCFGLVAILIHSFSDFGQHMPANGYLSAIFCALILSIARQCKQVGTRREKSFESVQKFKGLNEIILIAGCAIWIWSLHGADKARMGENYWSKALDAEKGIIDNDWQGTSNEYAPLINYAQKALNCQPDNVKYQYWFNGYRWQYISQTKDPDSGMIIIPEDSMPQVNEIINGFYKACILCPTYGPAYSLVGQIEKFVLNDDSGTEKIRKGFRLNPSDPVTCYFAGNLDVLEGKIEESLPKFQKAIQLDRKLFSNVVDIYVNQLSRPHLAITAAGDNVGWLNYVAKVLDDMQYVDLAEQVREKIKDMLITKCSEPDTPGSVFAQLGSIFSKQNDNLAAIECYHKALAREYSQVHWRLELAELLVRTGQTKEAMDEAKICLQIRPRLRAAETFIADLSVNPTFMAENVSFP